LDPTGSRDSGTNKKRQTDYFLTEKSYCWPIIAKKTSLYIHHLSAHEICIIIGSSSTHSRFPSGGRNDPVPTGTEAVGQPTEEFFLRGVLGVKNHD